VLWAVVGHFVGTDEIVQPASASGLLDSDIGITLWTTREAAERALDWAPDGVIVELEPEAYDAVIRVPPPPPRDFAPQWADGKLAVRETCPKCGEGYTVVVWHGPFFLLCWSRPRPHLHRFCRTCGYGWVQVS